MELKSIKSGSLHGLAKENLKLYFVKAGLKDGDPSAARRKLIDHFEEPLRWSESTMETADPGRDRVS